VLEVTAGFPGAERNHTLVLMVLRGTCVQGTIVLKIASGCAIEIQSSRVGDTVRLMVAWWDVAVSTTRATISELHCRCAGAAELATGAGMATQGAALQTQNNELVKCIEELREKRELLSRSIREEESEKAKIQQDLQVLPTPH
jgi:hypothetical protein